MRFLIHDFGGYAFPIQLSRQLALRGHYVTHAYADGLAGPKGRLERSQSDSERLEIRPVPLSGSFRKYSPLRRLATQRKYAADIRTLIYQQAPDVVLSANTPIDVQAELLWHCRRTGVGFVHWVQDVYCQALEFFLRKKVHALAKPLSSPFKVLEKMVATQSDSTIVIAPSFRNLLMQWGVPESRITVVENWGVLDELKMLPRQNSWGQGLGLNNQTTFLYSGTLGFKHRPHLLYSLAEAMGGCKVIVLTEGVGRAYLEQLPSLKSLLLLDFQPYDRLPEVLASADVLLATLETDAGQFAVPSKVLTYHCAGRPILLAAPRDNLAAALIRRSGAGIAVEPGDTSAWIAAGNQLASDAPYRAQLSRRGRAYAEESFNIEKIANVFEERLTRAAYRSQPVRTSAA